MAKVVDPELTRRINALRDFFRLLQHLPNKWRADENNEANEVGQREQNNEISHEDAEQNIGEIAHKYDEFKRTLWLLRRNLNVCIHEFEKIDDTQSSKFTFEIECVNRTYSLIFENSNHQSCVEYHDFADHHKNTLTTKKRLCTAMAWIGAVVLLLTPLVFMSTNPFVFMAVAAVGITAFTALVAGNQLAKKYNNQSTVPTFMTYLANSRMRFFNQEADNQDNLYDGLKLHCMEHQELRPEGGDEAFDQFFIQAPAI